MRRGIWLVLAAVGAGACAHAEVAMENTVSPATLGARDAVGAGEGEGASHAVVAPYSGTTYERRWNTGQSWGREWATALVLDALAADALQEQPRRAITGLRIDVKTFCIGAGYESVRADVNGQVVEVAP